MDAYEQYRRRSAWAPVAFVVWLCALLAFFAYSLSSKRAPAP
jgi:hypothetical protein